MSENEEQVLTAKAGDVGEAQAEAEAPKSAKKGRRGLWIAVAVLALLVALGVGALAGGAVGYKLARRRSYLSMHAPMRMQRWVSPGELPHRELPARPGRVVVGLESGAIVVEVKPDGPAEEAGIREGDVLIAVDGEPLDAESDLSAVLAGYAPGDVVTIAVAEPGTRSESDGREITVTLAEHPEDKGKAYLGVSFVPMAGRMYSIQERAFTFRLDDDHDCDEHREERFEFQWRHR